MQKEKARHVIDDIKIKPSWRSQGLGARVVCDCLAEARKSGAPLRLQVLRENRRAQAFYRRLGFQLIEETENHFVMEIS